MAFANTISLASDNTGNNAFAEVVAAGPQFIDESKEKHFYFIVVGVVTVLVSIPHLLFHFNWDGPETLRAIYRYFDLIQFCINLLGIGLCVWWTRRGFLEPVYELLSPPAQLPPIQASPTPPPA